LIWPNIPVFITVNASISKTITLKNVKGFFISWEEGKIGIGENISAYTFSDTNEHTIRIEGIDAIPVNFLSGQSSVTQITSKKKFSGIGASAFMDCKNINKFTVDFFFFFNIHDAITDLDGVFHSAFAPGSHIELDFGSDDLTAVGTSAFNSSKIYKVRFSKNATFYIAEVVFSGCTELVEVHLGHVRSLGRFAFNACRAIKTFVGDFSLLTQIGDNVFQEAFAPGSHIELDFGSDDLTAVGTSAFNSSKIYKVRFSKNATFYIAGTAFSGCTELVEAHLGHVVKIDGYAFNGCKAITTFDGDFSRPTQIGNLAFQEAFAPGSHIELDFGSDDLTAVGTSAFNSSKIYKVRFSKNAVFRIAGSAFAGCTELVEAHLGRATIIGRSAFARCTAIKTFDGDFSLLTQIEDNAFQEAFAPGSHIELDFNSDDLTNPGIYTFYRSKIYKVHFSENATFTLGSHAFCLCTELVEVYLGNVTSIEVNALLGCDALQTIRINSTNPPTLNSGISTNSLQKIYVPAASVSAYKNAENWKDYANRIEGF
jgi:hypothetical protein